MQKGVTQKHGRLCKNDTCVIIQFHQSELGKHGRHCALCKPQGSRPGIGTLYSGFTLDNEERQNGVWGR